jgi:flavin-dependent thymidylate synthase
MANTIPSSWEFVDFTFLISGVTRAFTHQLVRTRTASFAQQTMRVLDVSEGRGWDYGTGPTIDDDPTEKDPTGSRGQIYDTAMADIDDAYKELISLGAKIEDARGVLPTNILTNIVVKMNMRTFCEMSRKRASSRTQGEYRAVIDEMRLVVCEALPWTTIFLERSFDRAASELEKEIVQLQGISDEKRTQLIKLIDQMRMQA